MLTAARLAASGHHVYATMRDLNKKGALTDELNRRGAKADILQLDVTNKRSVKTAVTAIAAKYGYIDVLVNNAGYGIGGFFEDLTDEEIRQQMETNFFGVQNVTREVIPCMRQHRQGKIIMISSIAGLSASPCFGAYNASKWALEGFSESLRHEMKIWGIDVVMIEPGTYKTKIFSDNARYATNYNNPESPYYGISQFLGNKVSDYVRGCDKNMEDVPRLVEKLINSKHPPFRNIPDIETKILYALRRSLPIKAYMAMVSKALWGSYKLPAKLTSAGTKNLPNS